MNATAVHQEFSESDQRLHAAFIAHLGLPPETLDEIYRTMQANRVTFVQAAINLGLTSSAEVEDAMSSAVQAAGRGSSLIEAALLKSASSRQLIVREGSQARVAPGLSYLADAHHPRAEELGALRTQLLLLSPGSRFASVIAVVSPGAGEGRSRLSAELALSFAQLGKRTLLLEADLRRPTQRAHFFCQEDYGLADAIASDTDPYLHTVAGLPGMQVLLSGSAGQTNPLELLSGNRFSRLVNEWRNKFAFVIVDTPAVSEYADALSIAALAGNVLVLSRAKHTSFKAMQETMKRLAVTRSRILGAVVSYF